MKKIIIILVLLMIIVGASFLSFFIGEKKGVEQTKEKLQGIIDMAYPAPPQNLTNARGKITNVYGNKITFEMTDPKDYLPHPDGSPHKKIIRVASIGSKTKMIKLDYNNPQPDGTPTKTQLKITDFAENQSILVNTNENIRTNEIIPAIGIQITEY